MTDAATVPRTTLVLGGGGLTGIAWGVGLLAGLARDGVDLTTADLIIGTSAGSVTGALGLSLGPEAALDAQRQAADHVLVDRVPLSAVPGFPLAILRSRGNLTDLGQRLGRWSIERTERGRTVNAAERRTEIAERLPHCDFDPRLKIVAVDADSGERHVFTAADRVDLIDAVAASCAAPGIYPPVQIGNHRYIDGGARSATNADLARNSGLVVVVAPFAGGGGPLTSAADLISGTPHIIVSPDRAARVLMGRNVLNPAARTGSLAAGLAQAARVIDQIGPAWANPLG